MESLMEGDMRTAGPSPELKASIFSLSTWHWIQPFVSLGNAKTLDAEDLYELNPKEGTQHCEQLWDNAMEKATKGSSNASATPSVWKLMWHCFGLEYARVALFKPLWLVCVILQVYILRALVEAVADPHGLKWWWGTLLILGMFLMSATVSISQHMCFTLSQKVGMKICSTVSIAVYNKLLSTKLVSLAGTNSGLMLNLVTNDTQKLLDAAMYFHFAWFALVELCTVSILAIIEIGVSAIPGVVVAFLTQPLQVWMVRVGAHLCTKAMKYTDSRVQLTGEVLNGIRVIKYNGWIAPFLHRIAALRRDEIYRIKWSSFVRASTSTIRDSITPLASLATFGTYLAIHKGNFMQPSRAFTVLALFSVLVRTFAYAPLGAQIAGEAIVAMRRLQKMLNLDEHDNNATKDNEVFKDIPDRAVVLSNCSFSWEKRVKFVTSNMVKGIGKVHMEIEKNAEMDTPNMELEELYDLSGGDVVLKNINFSVGKGELVSIHGTVGSGKSSLLYGILGEMQCLKGSSFIQCNIAYVPQQPWILNDTVRQNIIFTSPFDPERYQRTIAACALEHDISQFPGGHDTEIGDRGINLSGGQKARISLARASYSSAPVVFLDDPLAAVDVPTAKHLIEHVLNGTLKGRTVILVTHNKLALSVCDRVYSMENGFLREQEELERSNSRGTPSVTGPQNIEQFTNQTEVSAILPAEADPQNIVESSTLQKLQRIPSDLAQNKEKGKSTVKEDRVEGNIKMSTWIAYGRASGGLLFFSFVMLVFIFGQAVRVMVDYWLRA